MLSGLAMILVLGCIRLDVARQDSGSLGIIFPSQESKGPVRFLKWLRILSVYGHRKKKNVFWIFGKIKINSGFLISLRKALE